MRVDVATSATHRLLLPLKRRKKAEEWSTSYYKLFQEWDMVVVC